MTEIEITQERLKYYREFFRGPMMDPVKLSAWRNALQTKIAAGKMPWMMKCWQKQLQVINEVIGEMQPQSV